MSYLKPEHDALAGTTADESGETSAKGASSDDSCSGARFPFGVELATGWALRGLVLAGATFVAAQLVARLALVTLPLAIALLLAALLTPLMNALIRLRAPRVVASLLALLGAAGSVILLLALAGRQVARGGRDLTAQVVAGLDEIRVWLMTGPVNASDGQISGVIEAAQNAITSSEDQIVGGLTEVTATVGQIVTGAFIVLFATFFFLSDGPRIWAWVVRVFPTAARSRVDSSGRVAWASLSGFVRATILVALADAIGVLIVAAALQLPFLFAIGVLVFLGAFIPVVGALTSGMVAVMVALVDQGPVVALVMLGGVVAVQQLEAHVLQPFVLGRIVALHPLGVVLSIAVGVLVAGIAGALVAVPLVAVVNSVIVHLSGPVHVQAAGSPDGEAEAGTQDVAA